MGSDAGLGEAINEGSDIIGIGHAMPGSPRIDDDIWALLTQAKAAGFVGHNAAFVIQAPISQLIFHLL
jgi:hypothetical protein